LLFGCVYRSLSISIEPVTFGNSLLASIAHFFQGPEFLPEVVSKSWSAKVAVTFENVLSFYYLVLAILIFLSIMPHSAGQFAEQLEKVVTDALGPILNVMRNRQKNPRRTFNPKVKASFVKDNTKP
jgi:hypothetical protein